MSIRWFRDLTLDDRPSVGGKGASLGELTRAGIAVPPGFVITTAAFEAALSAMDPDGRVRRDIGALDGGDLEAVGALTEAVRAGFAGLSLPAALVRSVTAAYLELAHPDMPVAVRSSATGEDSAEASFAGLQDTHLCVRGPAALLASVCACWASLYNRESVIYRRRLKIPERNTAMGVVVQRMLEPRAAGVMFTRSPLTGDRSVIVIEAAWGLGSALVSGEVTPDRYVVGKVTGEIVKRTISEKTSRHVAAPDGGVRVEFLDRPARFAPTLGDAEILALAAVATRVEQLYGAPQDIEWAIAPDARGSAAIHVLQSRPETVWAGRDGAPVAKPAPRAYDHVLAALGKGRR